jgi:Ca2+-binding EF-hand superfamily protein
MIGKIDKNHDGFVSEFELRTWIRSQHKKYLSNTAEEKWKKLNSNEDSYLTFDELIDNTIGGEETCKLKLIIINI